MKNLNFQSSLQIVGIKLFLIKSRLLGLLFLLLFFTTNTSLYSQEESCECPQGYFNYNLPQGDVAISTIFPLTNIVYQLCFHVAGNLIIDKDFQFLNCKFYMEGAGSIKVRNSSKLGLLSSNIQGCDLLWEGIELEDISSINSMYSSINDARFAIYNESGSGKNLVLAKNTLFRNNVIGIFSPPESGGMEIGPDFNGNTFESTRLLKGGLNDPSWPSTGDISYSGIVIQNSHFSIGKKNPLNSEINTFRNLINGISSWNNQVTIFGSEFININPSAEIFGQTIPEYYKNIGLITDGTAVFNGINTNGVGFANLVIEGFGKFGRNAFSNCVSGVVEKGGSCYVTNCRMSSVDNGVILSNLTTNFLGANFTGSSISNNFLAYNVNGISVFNCANNLIEVDNNDLTASTISGNRGINLNGNMNCQLRVTANIIASYGISGIWVSFCPGSVLLNNVVSNYGGLISNNFGYFITDSPNSILSCNGANSPRLGNGDFGFFIRANDDIKMECNAVDGYGVGYQFPTSNMGTDFFTNSMQNCYTGLFIGRYAIIGPQENYGNVYNDNNFNIGAKHDGDNFFIGMSLFKVENSNTLDYPKGNTPISTPNGNAKWYDFPGTNRPICFANPNGCSPFPTRVTNQIDDFIANWPTVNDSREIEARYYAQRYLYRKLKK
ncbi:MAG: hypothetical protein IPQ02_05795 [Saprospiraceae bacterium]|nr:hypothetical protein [Candidatus Defluviibacterium haderslevense]